ncbi:MAG: 1-deoxy-D-xylulose-5-phosphate reductoisomerase [Candidatus Eisenbacteria bacterium]
MKRIVLLGSTGSIGRSTLEVVRSLGARVEIVGLSANTRIGDLVRQVEAHRPLAVAVGDPSMADDVRSAAGGRRVEVFSGPEGLLELAGLAEADLVVNALVGAAGILPTLAAIEAGKDVAIANKESLVAAGAVIVGRARASGVNLIPVDSEHSAIYQCIKGESRDAIKRIILTASGGALADMPADEIENVQASQALRHPTWSMGRKVTIDSATLLNKGFEVIEAHWLFGIEAGHIEVAIERRSIVHSLVEFVDGSVMALLSPPDMRLPIQYALTFPDRVESRLPGLDLVSAGGIEFGKPDLDRFPCLGLAYEVAAMGGTAGAVLSAADEVAVDAYLEGRISFGEIHSVLRDVLSIHEVKDADNLDSVLAADAWAREQTAGIVEEISGRV